MSCKPSDKKTRFVATVSLAIQFGSLLPVLHCRDCFRTYSTDVMSFGSAACAKHCWTSQTLAGPAVRDLTQPEWLDCRPGEYGLMCKRSAVCTNGTHHSYLHTDNPKRFVTPHHSCLLHDFLGWRHAPSYSVHGCQIGSCGCAGRMGALADFWHCQATQEITSPDQPVPCVHTAFAKSGSGCLACGHDLLASCLRLVPAACFWSQELQGERESHSVRTWYSPENGKAMQFSCHSYNTYV